ncbi:unnamed protein product [Scytosiphon promiscuus]
MVRERVAILAATLLVFKCCPTARCTMAENPRTHQDRRRHQRAENFASHFPETGRFRAHHKKGFLYPSEGEAADEDWEEIDEERWSATLAALAASGTALALQAAPEDDRSQPPASPDYGRRRRRRPRPREENPDASTAAAAGRRDVSLVFQRLRAELASNLEAFSSWRRRRRRRQSATPAVPAAAAVAQRHLGQVTAHLSGLSAESVRRAENLYSAGQRTSGDLGIRIVGYGEVLLRRGRRRLLVLRELATKSGGGGGGASRIGRKSKRAGAAAAAVEQDERERRKLRELRRLTDLTVQNVVDVVARDGWELVVDRDGVVVHRQYIALGPDGTPVATGGAGPSAPAPAEATSSSVTEDRRTEASAMVGESSGGSSALYRESGDGSSSEGGGGGSGGSNRSGGGSSGGDNSNSAPQFACVKATAIISVPPEVVYLLFADNSRVREYNEHCREVRDLEVLSQDSKITWAASGRMGPFKARDFCTLVHFRTLSDGTLAQVSRPVEHPAAPRSSRYVRSEILLAGNFMRPVPGDPSRTEFLMVTHVNPGGAAETRAGAMLVNSLCASSPVNFIRRLEVAAQKLMLELQQQQQQQLQQGPPFAHVINGDDDEERCGDVDNDANVSDGGWGNAGGGGERRAEPGIEGLGGGIGGEFEAGGGAGGDRDGVGAPAQLPGAVAPGRQSGASLPPEQPQPQPPQQE